MEKGCLVLILAVFTFGRLMAGDPATAVATITAGFVTGITVTSGGSGYTYEPLVSLSGGGGSGATAKVILSGDKVALILVLTAGNGYSATPMVVVEAPPAALKPLGVRLELVPKLTVEGHVGSLARVESAASLSGPWTTWTNVTVGAEGAVLVDLSPGSAIRFYRAIAEENPPGTAGFVWIEPGTFVMGSPVSEVGRDSVEVQHTVTLTQGFWMSDHEVTQGEYEAVMRSNPSRFKGDLNRPVETVNWDDAVAYCKKLTERERAAVRITAQQEYRLPTESEWEYAARAGTTGARHGESSAIGWHEGNHGSGTNPVKQKAPNAWGLHDMMGNVYEWCSDIYGKYPTGSVTNPTGPGSGSDRVYRGGCWYTEPWRSAKRNGNLPSIQGDGLGFRTALSEVR